MKTKYDQSDNTHFVVANKKSADGNLVVYCGNESKFRVSSTSWGVINCPECRTIAIKQHCKK
jgi:hypothetical protein